MKKFINYFNRKNIKEKILYIFLILIFTKLIINILDLIKNNFSSIITVIGIIIIINFFKRN